MNLPIAFNETLETIHHKQTLPTILMQILDSIPMQERCETSLLASLRAKTTFNEWVASLLVINPKALLKDGTCLDLSELMNGATASLKDLQQIEIALGDNEWAVMRKVTNTPGDRSIVSNLVYIQLQGKVIKQARIAFTGVSSAPFEMSTVSQFITGKELDQDLVNEVQIKIREEFNPPDVFIATSLYRKEMAAVLIKRNLEKIMHGGH